jgi:putative transposase
MKRHRFSEEQIIGILKESEAGAKTKELCRKHGISDATFYNWKAKYAAMTVSEARRLRELEHENTRVKKLLAEGELDKAALKDRSVENGKPTREAKLSRCCKRSTASRSLARTRYATWHFRVAMLGVATLSPNHCLSPSRARGSRIARRRIAALALERQRVAFAFRRGG